MQIQLLKTRVKCKLKINFKLIILYFWKIINNEK